MNHLIKKLIVLTGFMTSLTAFSSAKADVLYDNGPVNGTVSAWTIDTYSVADTFTLTSQSTLTGLNFSLWNFAGDATTAVDWTILSSLSGPLLGSPLASGIQAPVTQTPDFINSYGYAINNDSIALPNISLAAGTYWIELQNAANTSGNVAYWDMNGGPSTVWENQLGYNPTGYGGDLRNASNTFQIIGSGSSVPEPASILLLAIGMIGLASLRKTRIH